jgi:hypothetical protein
MGKKITIKYKGRVALLLKSLVVVDNYDNEIEIYPVFGTNVKNYTAWVEAFVSGVAITAVSTTGVNIRINGVSLKSGEKSGLIILSGTITNINIENYTIRIEKGE